MRTHTIHKQAPLMKMIPTQAKPIHTTEKWRVKRSTHFINGEIKDYYWAGFGAIGDETPVWSKYLPENEANIRLIASAPIMLDALQAIADSMKGSGSILANQVRDAIHRATE